jgi:uncharacterized membrane protein YcaP (DUF421 family)
MDILKISLASVGSLIILFISTKLIGNKQMSELNMFDYINGITIGSIAAEMATSLESDFYHPIIAMTVYTIAILIISRLSQKKVGLRRFFTGKSIILMENGKIYQKNFTTAKIDINEFLSQCRVNGYFNVDDIDTAILEQNGKISFLPKVAARPVNTKDLNLALIQEKISVSVILDGNIMSENLNRSGNDVEWLKRELAKQNIASEKEVFLAMCNTSNNTLSVYAKLNNSSDKDVFQ